MAEAMRTCVLTRRSGPRDQLLRLVRGPDGDVVVDQKATLPGRGAWIWPDAESLELMDSRGKALARALGGPVDVDALRRQIRDQALRAVADGLSQAAAAGAIVYGQDRLVAALEADRLPVLAWASGGAERTRTRIERAATEDVTFVETPWLPEELGRRIGRGPVVAIGVMRRKAAAHLLRHLRRLQSLG